MYVGLVVFAVSGIVTLVASGMAPFPANVTPVAIDRDLPSGAAHQVTAVIFIALLVGHVAGVVSYQVLKGDVLGRMGIDLRAR